MSVRITVDDHQQTDELDRLLDMGPPVVALERILADQYQAAQARVHVITGSLRGSEKIDSRYQSGRWTGVVSFGGASPGFPNDPVDYAVYEAARGGPHDFTFALTRRERDYGRAMLEHLRGH